MNDKKKKLWKLVIYAVVIVLLGLAAIFANELARLVKGPVLCIYVGVLPKYILGLAFIIFGIDGISYGIQVFREIKWLDAAASALQLVLLIIFLFLIFPLSLKEGVPPGSTYNLMRLLIGLMFIFIAWDFGMELRKLVKANKATEQGEPES